MVRLSRHLRVEDGDWPEPAAEPGVEHILVLVQILGIEGRIYGAGCLEGLFGIRFYHIRAVREVPGRNALSPPELAADAPVVGVLHPVAVGVAVLVRNELYEAVFDAGECSRRELVHLEEPLGAEPRFDDAVGALRISYRRGVIFYFFDISGLFEHYRNLFARLEAVFAYEYLRIFVQAAVVVDDVDDRQIVAQAYFVVVGVVGRGHLEAAGSEVHFDIFVLDDRYLLVYQRNKHLLAFEPAVPFVVRIDADCRIRHYCLRTGGGNDYIFVGRIALSVGNEIAHVVELACGVAVYDLVVADCSVAFRIPVDHTHSPVDPTFFVEIYEGVDHGLGEFRLHREAGAVPVAGGAELAQLLQYDSTVLFFPFPGIFQELLAAEVFLFDAHSLELGNHLILGCDGGVVGAGNPAGVLAVHSRLAYEHIVKGVIEHVAHVQDACHVWWRNHYGIGFPRVGLGVEEFVFKPVSIPFVFGLRRIVLCRDFHFSSNIFFNLVFIYF